MAAFKLALMAFLCLSSFSHALRVTPADPKTEQQLLNPPDVDGGVHQAEQMMGPPDVDAGVHESQWGKNGLVPHFRLVAGSGYGYGYGSGSGSGSGSGYGSGTGSGYGSGSGSGSGYGYGRGTGSGSGSGSGTGVGIGVGRGSGSGYGPGGGSGTGIGIGMGQGGSGGGDCGYPGCNAGPIPCNPADGCWQQPPVVIPPCYPPVPTDCPYDNCPPFINGQINSNDGADHQEGHHHQSTTAADQTPEPRSGPAAKKLDRETSVVHNKPNNEAHVGSGHQGAPQVQQIHH